MTDARVSPADEAMGPSFRTLLVPLDDSGIAGRVFMAAVGLAKSLGARIHLLRVVTIDPPFPPAAHAHPDGLEAKLIADAHAELEKWMVSVTAVDFGPRQVMLGDPWRRILEVAHGLDADLIVMGCHRHHGVDRLLGTVASKVVNHSDCDVLVVHGRKEKTNAPAAKVAGAHS